MNGEWPSAITEVHTITIGGAYILVTNRRCKLSTDLGKLTRSFYLFTNYSILEWLLMGEDQIRELANFVQAK